MTRKVRDVVNSNKMYLVFHHLCTQRTAVWMTELGRGRQRLPPCSAQCMWKSFFSPCTSHTIFPYTTVKTKHTTTHSNYAPDTVGTAARLFLTRIGNERFISDSWNKKGVLYLFQKKMVELTFMD